MSNYYKLSLNCIDGNVVKNNGFVDKITPEMLPPEFDKQPASIKKCENAGRSLQKYLSKK